MKGFLQAAAISWSNTHHS